MTPDLKDSEVIVTGGNGFIGSNLVRRLVNMGSKVHVFSLHDDKIRDIKDKIKFYNVDVRDYISVKNACEQIQPDKIFHLASVVNLSRDIRDMDIIMDVKIRGTMNMIKALDNSDFDCFINTGTCEGYGQNTPPFEESMCPMPISPYSSANASMSIFCKMLYESNGIPITTLRQFTCYGPWQISKMLIPYVIKSSIKGDKIILTSGEQRRDFNYVDDAVESFILAATEKNAIGEIINIGTGESHRVYDIVNMIIKLTGGITKPDFGAIPHRKPEIWNIVADNSKAKKILGWEPKTYIEEGLRKTIDWYKKTTI